MIKVMSIDIETFSDIDIKQGTHKYISSPNFEILLMAVKVDDEPTICIDLANGETIPDRIWKALNSPLTILKAWKADFERNCIERFFRIKTAIRQWLCTMVKAAFLGLPLALGACGNVLQVKAAKDPVGEKLIKFFTMPQKATKKNPERLRNTAAEFPEKWQQFKNYCIRDVDSESEIDRRMGSFPLTEIERDLYVIDQKINDRGIRVDLEFVNAAIHLDGIIKERLIKEAMDDYSLSITSGNQVKEWLENEIGESVKSLSIPNIPFVEEKVTSERGKRLIELWKKASKTSIRKYYRMLECVQADGRIRGLFQFCGAGRTHRWGGRSVQPQNLPKNPSSDDMPDLDLARELVLAKDLEGLEMLFGDPSNMISKLIRTAFIPDDGDIFSPSDLASIEARVIAWIAEENWKLDVFNGDGKIYEATGERMFHVPKAEIKKGSPTRDKAKIAELALGFGGGPRALLPKARELKMTTEVVAKARKRYDEIVPPYLATAKEILVPKKGEGVYIKEVTDHTIPPEFVHIENKRKFILTRAGYAELKEMEELRPLVVAWREANPCIVQLWKTIERLALAAVRNPGSVHTYTFNGGKIHYEVRKGVLFCTLPSGTKLAYCKPRIYAGKYGDALMFEGIGENSKWTTIPTYGGSLVENIVQGTARDVLGVGMIRVDKHGYGISIHVHDELVPEIRLADAEANLKTIERLMSEPIDWAPGLPLKAEGFLTRYYKKD